MKRKASKPKLLRSKPFLIKRQRAGKDPVRGFWAVDYYEVLTNDGGPPGSYDTRVFSVCADGFNQITGIKLRPGRKRLFRLVEVQQS